MSSLNADKVVCESTKAEKMKHIASEFKEILMMRMMRSVPPKPPFHTKETDTKDTADTTSKKAPDGVFVSSIHIAREEEVRHVAGRDFEISQPLLCSRNVSLSFARTIRKHEQRENTFRLYFAYAHFSLSLMCD